MLPVFTPLCHFVNLNWNGNNFFSNAFHFTNYNQNFTEDRRNIKKNQSGIYVNDAKRISNPDIEMSLIKANEAEAIAEFPRGQPA